MNDKTAPKITNTTVIARSQLFQIEAVDLLFSNGNQRCFERIRGKRQPAIMIVPLINANTVLMIREFAAGSEKYEIYFPKGTIEPGEDILQAANRELKEEIGFGAKHFRLLKKMSSSPAYVVGQADLILAYDLYPARLVGDEPEELEVISCKLDDIENLIDRDDFTEARSIAALLLIKQKIKKITLEL